MRLVRRLIAAALILVAAVVVLPPVWFAVFGDPAPPAEMPPPGRRVELPDGLGVNVIEKGEGPPVVLVHGLPGSAYEWRNLQDELASRGRRVIAYDRVGYGRSDGRPAGATYDVDDNAKDLLALLEALDLRDATVVGWSYGGATAIAAAKRDPSRIARLVLVGSAGPGAPSNRPPALVRLLMSDPGLLWLRAVPPAARGLRASVMNVAYSGQPIPDWWMPVSNANFARPNTGRTYVGEMRAPGPRPGSEGLTLPMVIVHGDDDRLVPIAVGREHARRAPQAKLVVIAGGSHMLPVTHAPKLADEIVAAPAR
jgi:pimeloyl-ACP methyl ester carboxylesterase